jgi:Phycobilisome degradation protein nblA
MGMLLKSKWYVCQAIVTFVIFYHDRNFVPANRSTLRSAAMMSQNFELSLEQQFSVRSFQTQIQDMSREQAQEFLVQLYTQMLWQESTYKNLLKHQWGIEDCNKDCPGCGQ